MLSKIILNTLFLVLLSACAPGSESVKQTESQASLLPDRTEAVGFFSGTYKFIRDTERATYNSLYSIRDGMDSFVYDAQKDYYGDYQK